ncbi:zinc finger, CCHC-type containing protein [Tanacetum coccineum]|uniref:Zinc finger, CCHC-type containing protein n=1 Tax=Tanacetum coccineum TaxID=301880 RepID=A0ABQ4X1W5_9ASTR
MKSRKLHAPGNEEEVENSVLPSMQSMSFFDYAEIFTLYNQEEGQLLFLGKTVNELHAMLKLHEQTLPKNNAPALHAIRAARDTSPPKGKIPQRTPSVMSVVRQGLRASRKLNPGALSLYVGNGQREAVEAIGVFYLCLPSGLEIVLNNCHYAPSITIGCYPRDGIFEIKLSNSYENDSSIYTVSNKRAKLDLDSALLWHCRLGHISKKRIEKLQHDGLLNSTDLKAFEKCVPCMSGKMARKPYTHQVERVKDLTLDLIHTDDHGIIAHRTPPYTPQHNGVSKRRIRTLLDMVRSMMSQTTLPKSFWDYALETAACILNMVPTEERLIKNIEWMSLEDLKLIQEEDTHPSIDTSLNHEEDDLEIDEPQSDIIPIRRSIRTRHAPDRMCLYIKAALLDPESDKWLNTMNVEMQFMKDNEVWDLVELP